MPDDLFDIELSEVSLVDRGDNPGAHVVFYKRTSDEPQTPVDETEEKGVIKRVLKAVGTALGWSEEEVQKAESVAYEPPNFEQIQADKFRYRIEDELWQYIASLQDAMMAALSRDADTESKMKESLSQFDSAMSEAIANWSAGKSAMSKEDLEKAGRKISTARLKHLKEARDALHRVIEQADTHDDEGKVDKDVSEPVDKAAPKTLDEALALIKQLQAQLAAAKGGAKGGMKKDTPEDTSSEGDIYKDLSPEVRKRIEDMEKREQTATARIEKMEREQEEGEYITKAREDKLAEPEEVGKAMRRLDKGQPEEGDFEKVQKAYKAVIAQASTAELFKQRGSGLGNGGGSTIAKVNQKAEELRKSDPSLSPSAARSKVWETNPDLAEAYREEAV